MNSCIPKESTATRLTTASCVVYNYHIEQLVIDLYSCLHPGRHSYKNAARHCVTGGSAEMG
jgi:hypothetical protein